MPPLKGEDSPRRGEMSAQAEPEGGSQRLYVRENTLFIAKLKKDSSGAVAPAQPKA